MENIEFAIEYLKNNSYKIAEENNNYAVQTTNIAIEALEKQIPKPLADKWEINNYINGECQKCGEMGFNDTEDVEVFWMDEGEEMFITINNGDYEIIS